MKAAWVALLLASPLVADEVELATGTVVEGRVEDLGDSIRVTRPHGSVTYPKHLVRRIVPKKTVFETYEEKAAAIGDDDPQGRFDLALWCRRNGLASQAADEFRKVIALLPDHEEAREALGYRMHEGKWMTRDGIREAQGLVKVGGQWITPAERDLRESLQERRELDRLLAREVRNLLWQLRNAEGERPEEIVARLAEIDDAFKTDLYLDALNRSQPAIRLLAAAELGRMSVREAARPLARRAVWDESEEVREASRGALTEIKHPDTTIFFVPFLEEESTTAATRAAEALAAFPDPRAAAPLVAALERTQDRIRAALGSDRTMRVIAQRTYVLNGGRPVAVPTIQNVMPPVDKELLIRLETLRCSIAGTLETLSGRPLGTDAAAWRDFLRGQGR